MVNVYVDVDRHFHQTEPDEKNISIASIVWDTGEKWNGNRWVNYYKVNDMFKRGDEVILTSTGERVTIAQGQLSKSQVVIIERANSHQYECAIDLLKPVEEKENDNGMVSQ